MCFYFLATVAFIGSCSSFHTKHSDPIAPVILGKVLSGFAAVGVKGRMAIGIGMMLRGEVGLIFAAIGKSLDVLDAALFSAVVLMVIVTTLLFPSLFKHCLKRCKK